MNTNDVCKYILTFIFSGGVVIYFDRIEVVNLLSPAAGKLLLKRPLLRFLVKLTSGFMILLTITWQLGIILQNI